jgi:hypothetical protein
MPTAKDKLAALRRELEFLENGGYRMALGWRPRFIFEDSPVCLKLRLSGCPHAECVLMDLVPEQLRNQTVPCRYIPLDETGATLETLYGMATNDEIEQVLREWLLKNIVELERATDDTARLSTAA